jgi:hypothetical protein
LKRTMKTLNLRFRRQSTEVDNKRIRTMKHPFPTFNNVPPEADALIESARSQIPRLEFTSRNGETSETRKDNFKQHALEVVSASEKNLYQMSLGTFLDLWNKA